MRKILLVEDDADLFALLKYRLDREGFALIGSNTGKGVLDLCRREKPDLIILDIMLPDSDGLEICRRLRAEPEFAQVPVIFLTAKESEAARIVGPELGANDRIVKPFYVRELVARIKVHLRDRGAPVKVLNAGPLELNTVSHEVRLGDRPVPLTATEFKLLEFLMTRPGAVFSRDQLRDAIWGVGRAVTARTVDVYILRLRRKIESDPAAPSFIRSVRGLGYHFVSGTQPRP